MSVQRGKVAGIEYLSVGDPSAQMQIVLLHGYGADNQDLAPLSSVLQPKFSTHWYFPNGPLQVPIGPHTMGRAWFPIDMEGLIRAQMHGTFLDMSQVKPKGLEERGQQIANFLQATGLLQHKNLVLGGFSQGAMLTIETLFHLSTLPKAVVILSGALLDEPRWKREIAKLSPLPFFMSHGRDETLLDPAGAEALCALLQEHHWPGDLIRFRGGHEIPPNVLKELARFLDNVGKSR